MSSASVRRRRRRSELITRRRSTPPVYLCGESSQLVVIGKKIGLSKIDGASCFNRPDSSCGGWHCRSIKQQGRTRRDNRDLECFGNNVDSADFCSTFALKTYDTDCDHSGHIIGTACNRCLRGLRRGGSKGNGAASCEDLLFVDENGANQRHAESSSDSAVFPLSSEAFTRGKTSDSLQFSSANLHVNCGSDWRSANPCHCHGNHNDCPPCTCNKPSIGLLPLDVGTPETSLLDTLRKFDAIREYSRTALEDNARRFELRRRLRVEERHRRSAKFRLLTPPNANKSNLEHQPTSSIPVDAIIYKCSRNPSVKKQRRQSRPMRLERPSICSDMTKSYLEHLDRPSSSMTEVAVSEISRFQNATVREASTMNDYTIGNTDSRSGYSDVITANSSRDNHRTKSGIWLSRDATKGNSTFSEDVTDTPPPWTSDERTTTPPVTGSALRKVHCDRLWRPEPLTSPHQVGLVEATELDEREVQQPLTVIELLDKFDSFRLERLRTRQHRFTSFGKETLQ